MRNAPSSMPMYQSGCTAYEIFEGSYEPNARSG